MICPKCKELLFKENNTYKCKNNHSYDISKYGYVNLLLSKTNCGDPLESIKSRNKFLNKDYYNKLVYAIKDILKCYNINTLLDCGCGTGYYSSHLKDDYNITGIDISKDAVLYASKRDKKSIYIVASSSSIPIESNFFDAAYIVFAPLFEEELSRVLKDNSIFILVSPNVKHLYEIKASVYDDPYYNEPEELNLNHFTKISSNNLTYIETMNNEDIIDLVGMTPYFYKTSRSNLSKLERIDRLDVTIDFKIDVYKKMG